MLYSATELPDLISHLKTSTNPTEIKKCCASAAQIAQDLVLPDGENAVDGIEELEDDDLLEGLLNVVNNCKTQHKVAVRNAIRALADISKMDSAKGKLFDLDLFSKFHTYIETTAGNGRLTSTKEVFSYAACTLVANMLAEETVKQMLELKYTDLFLILMKSSIAHRPVVSVFAASILRQFMALPEGTTAILNAKGLEVLKDCLCHAMSLYENATDTKEDLFCLLRYLTLLLDSLSFDNNLDTLISFNIAPVLDSVFQALNTDTPSSSSSSTPSSPDLSNISPNSLSALSLLLKYLLSEDGETQLNESLTTLTMYYMLLYLSRQEPDNDTMQRLSKLCLEIGGSFTGDSSEPVTSADLITLLNDTCRRSYQGDSEVVFIITSLIVHLANFNTGVEGLQTPTSFKTRSLLLDYFLQQEKTEVVQSILRNECVMLNMAFDESLIDVAAEHNIFKHLNQALSLYAELNSEITETVVLLLARVAQVVPDLLDSRGFVPVLQNVLDFFTGPNAEDERRDTIVPSLQQILDQMPH